MNPNPRMKRRLISFFPGVSKLSGEQNDAVRWLCSEVLKVFSYRRVDWSQDDHSALAENFFGSVAALGRLRLRLKEDAPPEARPYAEKVIRLLDCGIAKFVSRRDGFQIPPFDDLLEAMLLGFAYADLHQIFQSVKREQCWEEFQDSVADKSGLLGILRESLTAYMSKEDAENLIQKASAKSIWRKADKGKPNSPLDFLKAPGAIGGPHIATIAALAAWRELSPRTVENRLDLVGTDADEPIRR